MFLNCTGNACGTTVILEAGTGDSSEVWNAVQDQVDQFAHVCSYDRLGLGKSDKLTVAHNADEIVNDLHQLLQSAHVSPPYVMVGHSIGGIYVRKYAAILSHTSHWAGVARLRARRAILPRIRDFARMGEAN
jgi:pimeloyl-ACP methyl ester carboxylesterase